MNSCVCTHPRADHTDTAISVPLTLTRPALYEVGDYGIGATNRKATYIAQHCWCGCTLYEPLKDTA